MSRGPVFAASGKGAQRSGEQGERGESNTSPEGVSLKMQSRGEKVSFHLQSFCRGSPESTSDILARYALDPIQNLDVCGTACEPQVTIIFQLW